MKKSIFLKTILAAYVGLASSVFADANIFRTMQFENEQPARRGNITLIRKSDLDAGVDNPFILTTTGTSNGAYQFQNVPTGNGINSNSTTIDYNMNVFTPNGSRGFSISANGTIKSIDLFNYSGQKLQTIDFNNSGSSNDKIVATVDLNGYASSVYFASLSRENGDTQTAKIVYDNTIGIRGIKNPPSLNVLINSSSKLNNSKGNNKILDNLPPYAQLFLENYEDLLVYPGVDSAETNANFYQVLEASDEPGATQFTPEINELYIQDGDDFGTDWVSKLAQVKNVSLYIYDPNISIDAEPNPVGIAGATVKAYLASNDSLLTTVTTDSDGRVTLQDIIADTDIRFEISNSSQYWAANLTRHNSEVTSVDDTTGININAALPKSTGDYPGEEISGVPRNAEIDPGYVQNACGEFGTTWLSGEKDLEIRLGDISNVAKAHIATAVNILNNDYFGNTGNFVVTGKPATEISDHIKNNYHYLDQPFDGELRINITSGSNNGTSSSALSGGYIQYEIEMLPDLYSAVHEIVQAGGISGVTGDDTILNDEHIIDPNAVETLLKSPASKNLGRAVHTFRTLENLFINLSIYKNDIKMSEYKSF